MRSWYWGSRVSRFWSSRLTARRLAAKRPRGAVPTRPCLLGSPPAVDGQNGSGDQTSGPRREEDNGGGDIGGRANAPDGDALEPAGGRAGLGSTVPPPPWSGGGGGGAPTPRGAGVGSFFDFGGRSRARSCA